MEIDIKTLIFLNFIVNFINAGMMTVIWRQYRKRFAGLLYWLVDMTFQALGAGLILLRGVVPDFFSIVLANVLLIAGGAVLITGIERFAGGRRLFLHNYAFTLVFGCVVFYFNAVQPNLAVREIAMSSMVVIFFGEIARILSMKSNAGIRDAMRGVMYCAVGSIAFNLARIALLIAFPQKNGDLFKSGFADVMAITLFITLNVCLIIALVLAVTGRLLREVRTQEEKFSKAFQSAPYAVLLSRFSDGLILEVNERFLEKTGYRYEEVIGSSALTLGLWEKKDDRLTLIHQLAVHGRVADYESSFRKKTGESLIAHLSAEFLEINGARCLLTSLRDVTEEVEMKRRLQEMATHDALTGLPNRRLLDDRFALAAANAARTKKLAAVLSLDLDKFKNINDTYGHAVGDAVLVEAGVRLRSSLRKSDTVARIGGDEFVVLLGDIDRQESAAEVAGKILSEFRRPFKTEGYTFEFSVSIGIALYPENGTILEDLLRKSDKAMYDVKEHGRNSYRVA